MFIVSIVETKFRNFDTRYYNFFLPSEKKKEKGTQTHNVRLLKHD